MKQLKNTLITLALILGVLGFSSCDSDSAGNYYWTKAYINSVVEVRSNSQGYFDGEYDIDLEGDVFDQNDKPIGRFVHDIAYYSGDIRIVAEETMPRLTLVLYFNGYEKSRIDLERIRPGENEFKGAGVSGFLSEVTQVLRRDGYAEIRYVGLSSVGGRTYMDIDVYMDINAYLRY